MNSVKRQRNSTKNLKKQLKLQKMDRPLPTPLRNITCCYQKYHNFTTCCSFYNCFAYISKPWLWITVLPCLASISNTLYTASATPLDCRVQLTVHFFFLNSAAEKMYAWQSFDEKNCTKSVFAIVLKNVITEARFSKVVRWNISFPTSLSWIVRGHFSDRGNCTIAWWRQRAHCTKIEENYRPKQEQCFCNNRYPKSQSDLGKICL